MLTADDKKTIREIVVDVIKDVLMPTLQLMDEKSDKIIQRLEKSLTLS